MPDTRGKALTYLRDGAVSILFARTRRTDRVPCEVVAVVVGHTARHVIDLSDGAWTCSCNKPGCAHVAAVQLVVGWPSAAAKPAKANAEVAA